MSLLPAVGLKADPSTPQNQLEIPVEEDTPPQPFRPSRTKMLRQVGKRTGQVAFWVLVPLICLIAVLVFVIPQAKAGAGLTIVSGSMMPAIRPGDVVAVKGIKPHEVCSAGLAVGDIATYMPESDNSMLVTHRVAEILATTGVGESTEGLGEDRRYESCQVVFRGDANNVDDPPVPARAVKGVVMYTVPKVGYALEALRGQTPLRYVAYGGAATLAILAIYFAAGRRDQEPATVPITDPEAAPENV